MFLTVHVALGFLLAHYCPNVFWVFLVSFFAHYLLDAIPHGDKEINDWLVQRKFNKFLLVTLIDAIIAFIFITGTVFYGRFNLPLNFIWAAMIGAILPDLLSGLYILRPLKILEFNNQIHHWAHYLIGKKIKPFSIKHGIVIQIITLAIIIVKLLW